VTTTRSRSAVALAACGGSSGRDVDATAITNVVNRWIEAVVQHDGPAACAQLSNGLRERIEHHLLREGVEGNCGTWAARWVSPRQPASHRDARTTAVHVDAERATVSLAAGGTPDGAATLVQENGSWRIADY
jgi:hypothetical protein